MAVGAMAQHPQRQENEDPAELEISLSHAIQLRAPYIKAQSNQLTLSSVRRLLERDLGLKDLYLEEHKAVIKGLVDKVLNETDNDVEDQDAVPEKPKKRRKKNSRVVEDLQDGELETPSTVDGNSNNKKRNVQGKAGDVGKENPTTANVDDSEYQVDLTIEKDGETNAEMLDRLGSKLEEPAAKGDESLSEKQGAGVQEVLRDADKEVRDKEGGTEETPPESNEETTIKEDNQLSQDTQEPSQPPNPNEDAIKVALSRRAADLKSQVASLTVTTVRHLLEEDLGLKRDGLKDHKQFIRALVDELLAPVSEEPIEDIGKEEEAQVNSEERPKKREGKSSLVKKSANVEEIEESEENLEGNGEVSDSVSEERRSNKVQKKRKKKDTEVKTKAMTAVKKITDVKRPFSAKVERLRDILKFVGVGVSPIVYRKAKQASEHERDEVLIKELENRLAQEGLSPNPTEKEMKKVKTRLEKKRDLDGIEHSNIVEEPRRSRASANSWFAPRPNKYAQVADKLSEDQDSDDDAKPVVTGAMDD